VWSSVATGQSHTCALKVTYSMWCWGVGTSGQLGQGAATSSTSPVQVSGTQVTWRLITAGTVHTCAVRTDSTVWCWGSNAAGQTGLGPAVTTQTTPAQLAGVSGRPIAGGSTSGSVTIIVP
jgi:alpha-tubulin suppressor-like RCC1 family protein